MRQLNAQEAYLTANEAKIEKVVLDVLKIEDIAKVEGRQKAFEGQTSHVDSSNGEVSLDLVGTTDSKEDS